MGKWKMVRLGDVCEVVSGTTPKTNHPEYWDGDIKWITPAEIEDNSYIIYDTERHITPEANLRPMPIGTVLLSSRAPIGKVAITGDEMCCNQGFKNLICSKHVHNRYLYRFMKSQTFYLNSLGRGATFKEISKSIVEDIQIPLPPLNVQQKIADVLDKASALIELRKAQLDKLNLLIKSQFVEMFGDPMTNPMKWEQKRLEELCSLITKGASPKWQGFSYSDDSTQTLFVTSENVREGYLDFEHPKFIEDAFNKKQKRSIIQKGDFLINIVGASIGRAAQYTLSRKANINQAVAVARLQPGIVNDYYLLTYLNSSKALQMYESMQVSVARANLSLQNISDLEILMPSLSLQNEFAVFVERVEEQKKQLQQSLEKLELNYKSLMQKCFRGVIF